MDIIIIFNRRQKTSRIFHNILKYFMYNIHQGVANNYLKAMFVTYLLVSNNEYLLGKISKHRVKNLICFLRSKVTSISGKKKKD